MKRQKVNNKKSRQKFSNRAQKVHKLNKVPASAFLRRGGVRL